VQFLVRVCLFQELIVFFLIGGRGVIKHHHSDGMTVSPEVLIVLLDGLSNFTQSVCGNNERQFFFAHKWFGRM
jgi:hypothetical protein